jgi:DnaJ-class molecular chaperone
MTDEIECPDCDGYGYYGPERDHDPCEMCQAQGVIQR